MEVLQVGEYVILTFLLDSLQHLPFIHHKCWEVEEGAASRREYNAGIFVGLPSAYHLILQCPIGYTEGAHLRLCHCGSLSACKRPLGHKRTSARAMLKAIGDSSHVLSLQLKIPRSHV